MTPNTLNLTSDYSAMNRDITETIDEENMLNK